MLISLLLALTPESPAALPADLGRAIQAETLARLDQVDPALAEAIHASDGPKPLTCSGLVAAEADRSGMERHPVDSLPVRPGDRYFVRVTGLVEPVSRALLAGLVEQPPPRWTLHGMPFRVLEAICDPTREPWTGRTSCETLAAVALQRSDHLPRTPPRTITLEFISPTAFKSQEMQVPVPLPGLVFGSLTERWNTFSTVALDPDLRRFAEERVAISRYQLESRPAPTKGGALRIGGIGQVTYTALDDDRYAVAALNILADFALYSGVGVQTGTGMGQCRRV